MSTIKPLPDSAGVAAAPAKNGAFAGQGDAAQRREAWQREMERAQMSAWFKPALAEAPSTAAALADRGGAAPTRGGMHGAASPAPATASISPAFAASSPLDVRGGLPASGPQAGNASFAGDTMLVPQSMIRSPAQLRFGVTDTSQDVRPLTEVQPRGRGAMPLPPSTNESGMENASASELQGEQVPTSSPAEEQAPLRLHEESLPEGQAVWIAMRADDDALAAMLPRIVADLQRAMTLERGQRLCQVVCNGRLVWRDSEGANAAASIGSSTSDSSFSGVDRRPIVFDSFQSKGA